MVPHCKFGRMLSHDCCFAVCRHFCSIRPSGLVGRVQRFGLDLTKWTWYYGDGSQYGIPGWGNNEWQSYTDNPANLFVEDGRLHIVARQQNNQYTSARIPNLGNAEFTYGRMEARIKLPAAGQGLWPAFWMLPTNSPYGGWAAGGEIDIVEWINGMDVVHGTLHHGSAWPNNQQTGGSFNPAGDAITAASTITPSSGIRTRSAGTSTGCCIPKRTSTSGSVTSARGC